MKYTESTTSSENGHRAKVGKSTAKFRDEKYKTHSKEESKKFKTDVKTEADFGDESSLNSSYFSSDSEVITNLRSLVFEMPHCFASNDAYLYKTEEVFKLELRNPKSRYLFKLKVPTYF